MLKLKHKATNYYSLYDINRPDLGIVGKSHEYDLMKREIIAYRKERGLDVGLGLDDQIQELICAKHEDLCEECDPALPPLHRPDRLYLSEVVMGTEVMLRLLWARLTTGRGIVSQEEASRRADICCSCRYNTPFPKGCGGNCGPLRDLVKKMIGNKPTPRASELQACAICHCFLTASVWVELDIQWPPLSDNQKSQFNHCGWCWKKDPSSGVSVSRL